MARRARIPAVTSRRRAALPWLLLAAVAAVLCGLFPVTLAQSAAAPGSPAVTTTATTATVGGAGSASHAPGGPHTGTPQADRSYDDGSPSATLPRAVRDSTPERHLAHPLPPAGLTGDPSYGPTPRRGTLAETDTRTERVQYDGPRTGRAPPAPAGI